MLLMHSMMPTMPTKIHPTKRMMTKIHRSHCDKQNKNHEHRLKINCKRQRSTQPKHFRQAHEPQLATNHNRKHKNIVINYLSLPDDVALLEPPLLYSCSWFRGKLYKQKNKLHFIELSRVFQSNHYTNFKDASCKILLSDTCYMLLKRKKTLFSSRMCNYNDWFGTTKYGKIECTQAHTYTKQLNKLQTMLAVGWWMFSNHHKTGVNEFAG